MEVDDDTPYWLMEEEGYKPSDSPPTVSKRQQHKGFGPPTEISAFNSIEALEKDHLAWLPSNTLNDPALWREREGVINNIVIQCLAMKNRISGPSQGISLPPPGSHLLDSCGDQCWSIWQISWESENCWQWETHHCLRPGNFPVLPVELAWEGFNGLTYAPQWTISS